MVTRSEGTGVLGRHGAFLSVVRVWDAQAAESLLEGQARFTRPTTVKQCSSFPTKNIPLIHAQICVPSAEFLTLSVFRVARLYAKTELPCHKMPDNRVVVSHHRTFCPIPADLVICPLTGLVRD